MESRREKEGDMKVWKAEGASDATWWWALG